MAVFMRLVSLILIVAALMMLGTDVIVSLEKGGEITVRSLGTVWGALDPHSLSHFKDWIQNRVPFLAQFVYQTLVLPGWAVTGVIGVILAFSFSRLGSE